jgi:hypothetical protein
VQNRRQLMRTLTDSVWGHWGKKKDRDFQMRDKRAWRINHTHL